MHLEPVIRDELERWRGEPLARVSAVGGGCIAETARVTFASGNVFFLKFGAFDPTLFRKEANGLNALRTAGALRVPQVFLATERLLLLEWIPPGRKPPDFFERFGRALAGLHRVRGASFGFFEDNFIGATPQPNPPTATWSEFYVTHRLHFQFRLAERKGYVTPSFARNYARLEARVPEILSGSEEPPTLLHGDLWSGNYLVDEAGAPCLIDPAVYYGHREAELAMTKLFGGFPPVFHHAYAQAFPLPPGHAYRENLYKLYHVMNHLNLFGRGYLPQALSLVEGYL